MANQKIPLIFRVLTLFAFLSLAGASPHHTESLAIPDQVSLSQNNALSTLIQRESLYFMPGIGLDLKTGMPFDNLRIRKDTGSIKAIGRYSAPSKLSLSIPFLLNVIQKHPDFDKVPLTSEQAASTLEISLRTLLAFQKKHPDYQGFFPWFQIQSHGALTPQSARIPSLDNGELSWALAAVQASLEKSEKPSHRKLAAMAKTILAKQSYAFFVNSDSGKMTGELLRKPKSQTWLGSSYELNDMYEGILAILWGILHGQVSEKVWDGIPIVPVDYVTAEGKKITLIQGFRASFHELWAAAYLPMMESPLAPFYKNYLEAQIDYAERKNLPGFLSTAYEPYGVYRQIGIPEAASHPVERDDVAVVYATAMGMLIDAAKSQPWLEKICRHPGILTPYGAVESVDAQKGAGDILTADGKGMTLLAVSGGIVGPIKDYLSSHKVPGTQMTMEKKLQQLLARKYRQLMIRKRAEMREKKTAQKKYFPPTKRI